MWEDPGFVIIEAAACNLNIISSDCKKSKEILLNGRAGYLFKNNDSDSFKKVFELFMNSKQSELYEKKLLQNNKQKNLHFFHITKVLKI